MLRREQPDEKSIASKELWTIEGVRTLLRKIASDPGLTESFRQEAIVSVKDGALERGAVTEKDLEQFRI